MVTYKKMLVCVVACAIATGTFIYNNTHVPETPGWSIDVACPSDVSQKWASYVTSDGKISFLYPQDVWDLNTLNEKEGVITVIMNKVHDPSSVIQIMEIMHNGVSFSDTVNNTLNGAPVFVKKQYTLDNLSVIDLTNTSSKILLIDKKNYYVSISAPLFQDSAHDCLTKRLLTSLRIVN